KGDFAKLDPLAGMDGLNSGAVQVLPELDDGRISAPPVGNVVQDLDVRSIVVGIETAPSAKRTAVSESQIRGLADLSSRFILWRHRSPEHPRRGRTVGFQRRITGDVVATVILKFPHSPATHASARLSIAERSPPISWCCPDVAQMMERETSPATVNGAPSSRIRSISSTKMASTAASMSVVSTFFRFCG